MQSTPSPRKANVMVVGIALVLSLVVYVALTNFSSLPANIPTAGTEFVDSSDLVLRVDEDRGTVEILVGKTLEGTTSMSFLGFYNPEEVSRSDDSVKSKYDVAVAAGDPGEMTILLTFPDGTTLDRGDTLMTLDITGNPHEVTVSDVVVEFNDTTKENLGIALP